MGSVVKRAGFILIVIILLLIINNLLHSIYDLWHKQDLLTQAQKQLISEKLKNQKAETKNKLGVEMEDFIFLYVGRQSKEKLPLTLIENGISFTPSGRGVYFEVPILTRFPRRGILLIDIPRTFKEFLEAIPSTCSEKISGLGLSGKAILILGITLWFCWRIPVTV